MDFPIIYENFCPEPFNKAFANRFDFSRRDWSVLERTVESTYFVPEVKDEFIVKDHGCAQMSWLMEKGLDDTDQGMKKEDFVFLLTVLRFFEKEENVEMKTLTRILVNLVFPQGKTDENTIFTPHTDSNDEFDYTLLYFPVDANAPLYLFDTEQIDSKFYIKSKHKVYPKAGSICVFPAKTYHAACHDESFRYSVNYVFSLNRP